MRWRSFLLTSLACFGSASIHAQTIGLGNSGSTESSVHFSGQVQMEDGTRPPEAVTIQKICDGRAVDIARTDSQGRFGFDFSGSSREAVGDASAMPHNSDVFTPIGSSTRTTNPVTSSLKTCELKATLPGFSSDRVDMNIRDTLDNTNVGTLILHPTSKVAELSVSATSLAAPSAAKRAFDKGHNEAAAQKWQAAAKDFEKAVDEYPAYAAAWYELGLMRQNQKDATGAVDAWKAALKSDPKYLKPYEALAQSSFEDSDWKSLDQYASEWIKLDADAVPQAYLFNAFAAAKLGRNNDAEQLALRGLLADKQRRFVKLDYVLGVVCLQEGKYAESAKYFREYLGASPQATDAEAIRQQLPRLEAAAAHIQ